ncbi:hypothetical protein PANT111_120025 [Pantoea brenneri]|uniref:Type II toxin-antitoxin system VapC family toxin n=1 Tax=Pantoea brenneri TaxID=472694 RepID=A0AAX3J1F2_9GAMM|nr:hypothetical protein PANT111_120025 [Pantoea brenneri]
MSDGLRGDLFRIGSLSLADAYVSVLNDAKRQETHYERIWRIAGCPILCGDARLQRDVSRLDAGACSD